MNEAPHPTVAVWWTDAESIDTQTRPKEWGPLPMWVTRGLLVEDGDVVSIAASYCPERAEYDGVTRIPRGLVSRMEMYIEVSNAGGNGQVVGEDRPEGRKA